MPWTWPEKHGYFIQKFKWKFYVLIKITHPTARIFEVNFVQVQLYKAYLKYKQLKKQGVGVSEENALEQKNQKNLQYHSQHI